MGDPVPVGPLNARTLASWGKRMPIPRYDRSQVAAGIVHIGVGGFHRAHQAMYADELMNQGASPEWGICGVGVMPADRAMRDALAAQDGLYTLVIKHSDGTWEPRVVGSIVQYLFAPDDPEAVLEKMAAPATRVVSLTVTEGGYNISDTTGRFDTGNADVRRDVAPGAIPRTAFGLMTEALRRRRERGLPPFTVMSCDNLPGNGDLTKGALTAFARMRDEDLADWIAAEAAFPNAMVDRITPETTEADLAGLRERFGLQDRWPVVCEPFVQWILQDEFTVGRPAYEQAGVQLVDDVTPYELMKLRLLNASHQALAYFGYLAGYRLVHEAAQDELFRRFLRGYMDAEATPTLAAVPGVDLEDYKGTLIERFSNPQIGDTIARLCAYSSDRIPKWLLPVVREQLAAGGEIRRAAAVVASWARYAEGFDERGEPVNIVDRLAPQLTEYARRERDEPNAFISQRLLFGDLAADERFATSYQYALRLLHERGARDTLDALT